MPLKSLWLSRNERLQQCFVADSAHVKTGDAGDHVTLIQGALWALSGSRIPADEQARQLYGRSTAEAVLNYKRKHRIINYSYQTVPDNIVGRMTIQSLDAGMVEYERQKFGLLLAFGVPAPPRGVVLSQTHPLPAAWARQVVRANPANMVNVPTVAAAPRDIVKKISGAIKTAGAGGLLVVAVGHGVSSGQFPSTGAFDVADHHGMRIGGRGSNRDPKCFVDVFYDTKPPAGSPSALSDKEMDEQFRPGGWQERLDRWTIYEELCKSFVDGKLTLVVILTCRVGNSVEFLKKVAVQWQTTILAYRDFVWYEGVEPHVRAVLDRDIGRSGTGTNVPFSEICFPISMADMVFALPT
jgi:hypothetical protein